LHNVAQGFTAQPNIRLLRARRAHNRCGKAEREEGGGGGVRRQQSAE
jgi:hypothetical protein